MDNERCEEHKCGGERKRSREFDRELESGPGLFDGVLVDAMSGHSEVGTSLASSAYIEWLAQQRDRSTFDAAQGFHHTHIKDPDQAQLSSASRETFQQYYQLYSCSSMVWQPGQQRGGVCLLRCVSRICHDHHDVGAENGLRARAVDGPHGRRWVVQPFALARSSPSRLVRLDASRRSLHWASFDASSRASEAL